MGAAQDTPQPDSPANAQPKRSRSPRKVRNPQTARVTLDDAAHPLYGAASAALLVGNGRHSGNAMAEAVAAMAKREPMLAAAPDLYDLAQAIVTAFGDKILPTHTEKHLLDGARAALAQAEGRNP